MSNGKLKLSGQTVAVPANIKILGNSSTSIVGKPIVAHGQVKDGKAKAQSIELRPMKIEVKNRPERSKNTPQPNSSRESGENISVKATEGKDSNKSENKYKKGDKAEFSERIEKTEKIETVEKIERVETPDRVEKVEKVEKVETPEKTEKIERVEKVEKAEKRDD